MFCPGETSIPANIVTMISCLLQVSLMSYILYQSLGINSKKNKIFQIILIIMVFYGSALLSISVGGIIKRSTSINKLKKAYLNNEFLKKDHTNCESLQKEQNVVDYLNIVHSFISFMSSIFMIGFFLNIYLQEKKTFKSRKFAKQYPGVLKPVNFTRGRESGVKFLENTLNFGNSLYNCKDGLNWNMFLILISSTLAGSSATSFGLRYNDIVI
jgi:hypothetical protein